MGRRERERDRSDPTANHFAIRCTHCESVSCGKAQKSTVLLRYFSCALPSSPSPPLCVPRLLTAIQLLLRHNSEWFLRAAHSSAEIHITHRDDISSFYHCVVRISIEHGCAFIFAFYARHTSESRWQCVCVRNIFRFFLRVCAGCQLFRMPSSLSRHVVAICFGCCCVRVAHVFQWVSSPPLFFFNLRKRDQLVFTTF